MSDLNYSSDDYFSCNSNSGSSGNEADSEGEEAYAKEANETMMKTFNHYLYEPEKDVSDTDSSNESEIDKSSSEEDYSVEKPRVGNNDWCKCGGNCKTEKRNIDCLCSQEVHALNSKFNAENYIGCITESKDFETLCTNKTVLENVLVGLHEARDKYLEENTSNRSFRYAAYRQFIRWVFKRLSKGNRRVIPSRALWKIREHFPEPDEEYVEYSEGNKD